MYINVFHLCSMSPPLYMIGFLTMPRRLGVVLERLRDVLGEVWRHVGVSGKRRGEFFAHLRGF